MKSVQLVGCESFASAAGVFKKGVLYPVEQGVFDAVMAEHNEYGVAYFEEAPDGDTIAEMVGLGSEAVGEPAFDAPVGLPEEPEDEAPKKTVTIGKPKGKTVTV